MKLAKRFLLILLCVLGVGTFPAGVAAQESGNLLQNPGFDEGFYRWNGINELDVGHGWTPWWVEDPNSTPPYLRPEFKEALARDFSYRVRNGTSAQQWFKLYSSHFAGIYQQVMNVTPGTVYRFTAWGQVWSSTEDNPATISTLPANPHLQIGIDPTGNWDPFSPNIVWSPEALMSQVIDQYGFMSVEATAQNNVITVFVRARPEFSNKHNNIYIDDTSLVAVGPAGPPPSPTAPPPTETLPPTEAPPASPTPLVTNTPPATATTAPTESPPPTETPAATDTPEPTATSTAVPSDTPAPTETAEPEPESTATPEEVADIAPTATTGPAATEPTDEPAATEEPAAEQGGTRLCGSPVLGMLVLGVFLVRRRRH